ncbi:MAG: metallophosphoesterase [Clostridia bacterium]|nr:metallophosphoesterase [Clostridia bacterium]
MWKFDPCVYAVDHEYQIVCCATETGIAWVECGGQIFRDSVGGLMRSESLMHRISLPMDVLDRAGCYTLCFQSLPERRPYFPQLGAVERAEYSFHPLPATGAIRAVMLADTHSMIEAPVRASQSAGTFNLLLLNGDIPAESKRMEDLHAILDIASQLTHGSLPIVFARGNHDYRGRLATELTDYIGTRRGDTFFTFRLGGIWGIVLDCGEDKDDTDIEYGGMVDCHNMRLIETAYIQSVIENADHEYDAPDVTTRIALCHIPFCTETMADEEPKFDIERELFSEWTKLLNCMKLDIMLCGHTHTIEVIERGSKRARYNANFPIIIGSRPVFPRRGTDESAVFSGIAATINGGDIRIDEISSAHPPIALRYTD